MTLRLARALLSLVMAGLFLGPLAARAEDVPCRREGERVTCSSDGFKTLTDACVQSRADAKTCGIRLAEATKDVALHAASLEACQAALAAVPPPEPPRSPLRPLLGLGAGVVGALLASGALVATVPEGARFPLALAGVGLVAGGVVLVWP